MTDAKKYKAAIADYADGRAVCICGEAYKEVTPSDGDGVCYGVCPGGCSANRLLAGYGLVDKLLQQIALLERTVAADASVVTAYRGAFEAMDARLSLLETVAGVRRNGD
jgi:hypothetical protein